jgi:hypothetical protein
MPLRLYYQGTADLKTPLRALPVIWETETRCVWTQPRASGCQLLSTAGTNMPVMARGNIKAPFFYIDLGSFKEGLRMAESLARLDLGLRLRQAATYNRILEPQMGAPPRDYEALFSQVMTAVVSWQILKSAEAPAELAAFEAHFFPVIEKFPISDGGVWHLAACLEQRLMQALAHAEVSHA